MQIAVLVEVAPRAEGRRGTRPPDRDKPRSTNSSTLATQAVQPRDLTAQPFGAQADQEEERRNELEDQAPVKRVAPHRRGDHRQQDRHDEHDPGRPRSPRQRSRTDQPGPGAEATPRPRADRTMLSGIDEDLEQDADRLVGPENVHRQRPDRQKREIPEAVHRRVRIENAERRMVGNHEAQGPRDAEHAPDGRVAQAASRRDSSRSKPFRSPRRRRPRETRHHGDAIAPAAMPRPIRHEIGRADRMQRPQRQRHGHRQIERVRLQLARIVDQVVREREKRQSDQRRAPAEGP